MINRLKQYAILLLTLIIVSTIASITFAEDAEDKVDSVNISTGINETKKILDQTALIEKTLQIETKELNDLSKNLQDVRSKTGEFESQTNVYKIELTTFANQLNLPDVDTKLIEKAYMSSQTAVGKIDKELVNLREKTEQLKQLLQISYEQKIGNDKFLIELQVNINQSNTNRQTQNHLNVDSNQSQNKNKENKAQGRESDKKNDKDEKTDKDIKNSDIKDRDDSKNSTSNIPKSDQDKITQDASSTPLEKNQEKLLEQQRYLSGEQKGLSMQEQLALGKHGDPMQKAALEQRIALELELEEEKRVAEAKKAAEEQKAAEELKAALIKLQIRLKYLQTALAKKMLIMQSTALILNQQIPVLEEIQGKYKLLVSELEIRIRDAKKADLLTRTDNPLTQNGWKRVGDDIKEIVTTVQSLFYKDSWIDSFSFLWLSGVHKLFAFIVILLMVSVVSIRLKQFIKNLCVSSHHFENRYWSKIVLEIFSKNLLLSSVTGFLYLCIKFKLFFSYAIVLNLIVEILMILIFILWSIYFLEHIQKRHSSIPSKELILFLKALNLVVVIYILLNASLRIDSSIIILYRLMCEILFYGWLVYFLKKLVPVMVNYFEKQNKTIQKLPTFCKNGIIMAALTGIVLELLGYGTLAFYWYTSWGKTMIILMWSGLIIGASREWILEGDSSSDLHRKDSSHSHGYGHINTGISMLWLIKKISFLAMFFIVTIALMLSWASSDFVFPWLYVILTFKFVVGSMSFSVSTIAQAIMILILTHFLARAWKTFFKQHFLGESGLDQGLQESMTTITVYSIWILGIFTALIVFGLNATTLTVAFGALSIGIGFGLQNIVSNFISGIILLFERPIQVGDEIEVNGIWATVKKTNVRSTLVQTYENATIIIPNSELISNSVINWSFKDRRLRRKVKVGVEYGSDVELVKKTLLEIASRTPRVLKFPEPDVLFEDFGDSALMFGLRFWTFTDYFLSVETDIRFKIDKVFKEKNIVIAFPQQDIHIRTLPSDFMKV